MKIRWKFFLILFAFSLVPLVSVTHISQEGTEKLGQSIINDSRQNLLDIASKALELTVSNYAKILRNIGNAVELGLVVIANSAERALAQAPPATGPIYFASDYDDPQKAPPDLKKGSGQIRQPNYGDAEAPPVSIEHPVFLIAPGTDAASVQREISQLTRILPDFKSAIVEFGDFVHWMYVSLEKGVHMSYPGHGGYPPGYDGRRRPWYQAAVYTKPVHGRVLWTPPNVDATSGLVTFTASRRINYPDGSLAGVAALDVLITRVIQENELVSLWSSAMRSFMTTIETRPPDGEPGLLILAQKDYQQQANSWQSVIEYEWLRSSDKASLAFITKQLSKQQAGHAILPYAGIESIWAFAPVDENTQFIIIVPLAVIKSRMDNINQTFLSYVDKQLLTTGIAAVAVFIVLTVAALLSSRAVTRSLLKIAAAAKKLARGDFSVRLNLRTGDERDQVIRAFNEMVPKLEDHYRIRNTLELAREVQQNLLPVKPPKIKELDIAGATEYCEQTGGDYYDFFKVGDAIEKRLAVIVGDVSGHGVPSALLMTTARALLRQRAAMPGKPCEIVTDVNRRLSMDTSLTSHFMTLFYSEFNISARQIHWVRAGHEPAIIYDQKTDQFDELKGNGLTLGVDDTFKYEQSSRHIEPGQIILIGTDGIWEMHNTAGAMFGKEELKNIVGQMAAASADDIQKTIVTELARFRGSSELEDDVTIVIVKVNG